MSSVCPNANTGNSSRASQSVRSIHGASGREIQEMGQGRRLLALHRWTIRSNAVSHVKFVSPNLKPMCAILPMIAYLFPSPNPVLVCVWHPWFANASER